MLPIDEYAKSGGRGRVTEISRSKYSLYHSIQVEEFLGKTFSSVRLTEDKEEIQFIENNGTVYAMYHQQDCCEAVEVEDIVGDISDLIGSAILRAEERSREGDTKDGYGTYTYTFYELATVKGAVTIRWYGESNGHYSEAVELADLSRPREFAVRLGWV